MKNQLIQEKKLARMAKGVCINCGLMPCRCAIPKAYAKTLPLGMRRFKKRSKTRIDREYYQRAGIVG